MSEDNQSSVECKCLHMFWLQPNQITDEFSQSLWQKYFLNSLRSLSFLTLFSVTTEFCSVGRSRMQSRGFDSCPAVNIYSFHCAVWVLSCSKMEMSHWHMCKLSSRFFVFVVPGEKSRPRRWQHKQYRSCSAKCTLVGASSVWWWWAHEGRLWLCRWWWIDIRGPSYRTVIGAFYELTCIILPCSRSCGWVPLGSTTWCIYDWNQFSQWNIYARNFSEAVHAHECCRSYAWVW